jgi:hypothetical protein
MVWLLDQKVPVNPLDRWKRTPLEDALRGEHIDCVNTLREHGGKIYENGKVCSLVSIFR